MYLITAPKDSRNAEFLTAHLRIYTHNHNKNQPPPLEIPGDMLSCTTKILALSPDCRANPIAPEWICDLGLAAVVCLKNCFRISGKPLTDALGMADDVCEGLSCRRIFGLCPAEG